MQILILYVNFLFKNQKKRWFFSDIFKTTSKSESCITSFFTQTSEPRSQTSVSKNQMSEPESLMSVSESLTSVSESLTSESVSHSSSSLFRRWK